MPRELYNETRFKSRRTKVTETMDNKKQNNGEIGKEQDKTNPEDLSEYIWLFTHLFNKKKFKKLLERCEWDYEINLTDEAPKELNVKAYAMTLKEKEALNQWLDMSGVVHTGVEVCRMDSEMSGLVERPWLQLMCCAVCLPRGCNFR